MSSLVYARPSDRVVPTATVQSGTGNTDYVPANLVDLDPGNPAKLTTTTGAWLFDFGTATSVELFTAIHHNWTAGLNVRLQGNASNSWGAPTLDAALTIPAYGEDGFPTNPWLDLSGGAHSFRYWRLATVGTNAVPVALGEALFYSTKRTLEVNISWGASFAERHNVIEHRTDQGASLVYDLGTRQRLLKAELDTTDVGMASMRSLNRAAKGRVYPFPVIPDGAVNEALLMRFLDPQFEFTEEFLDSKKAQVSFEEVSSGLVLA